MNGSISMPSGNEGILLTGATGLVGGAVLARLAGRNRQRVYCLVRARTGRSLASRIAERLGDEHASTSGSSTIVPIAGDVTDADLGLAQEVRATLQTNVETIVHCAANTSFLASADSWRTNTEGTRNLLALASKMPNLKQFIFIGSAASSISDANVEVDEDAPVSDPTHFVEYTKTKQAAEQLLLSQPARYRKVIIRPSYVIPDELLTPATIRQAMWPLSIMAQCRLLPIAPEARLDVIPLSVVADYVARVVAMPPKSSLYYLSGGIDHSPIWRDVIAVVSRTFGRSTDVELVSPRDWPRRQLEVPPRFARLLDRVAMFFPFINRNVTFRSDRLFSEYGYPDPTRMDVLKLLPRLLRELSPEAALEQSSVG